MWSVGYDLLNIAAEMLFFVQSNMATVLINDPIRVYVCLPPYYNVLPTRTCMNVMVVQYRESIGPICGGVFLYWTCAGFFYFLFFSQRTRSDDRDFLSQCR